MLSIGSVGSAGAAAGYYTKDNYYSADQASASSAWFGAGAAALGLDGIVHTSPFEEVLAGRLPDGTVLEGGPGGEHRPGIDLTFSAPKSISLLALVGGDKRLLEANFAAVEATLEWAQTNLAETRMRKAGAVKPVKTGNLVAALFEQDTSRSLDPQLHVHAVIANATKGPDGKWRALHNDKLWSNNTLLGAIYHSQLRAGVEALGYETQSVGKHGTFEIKGIDRKAIDTFSTRHNEIDRVAEVIGATSFAARDTITLKTRDRKKEPENRAELVDAWKERAREAGLDLGSLIEASHAQLARGTTPWSRVTEGVRGAAKQAASLAHHFAERIGLSDGDPLARTDLGATPRDIAAAQGVGSAIRHLSQRETSFTAFEVAKTALDFGLPITIADVERRVARLVKTGLLERGKGEDVDRLTTRAAVDVEQRILSAAVAGRGGVAPIVASIDAAGERAQAKAEAGQGFRLNPGQEAAARLLLASADRVVAVQGVAGAGKSSALRPVAEIAREEGRGVLALGPQNTLVRQLGRDVGVESQTIASFVRRYESLLLIVGDDRRVTRAREKHRGSVVLVDESSMTSNDQALRLVLIAEKLELGRLAFVGDRKQLGAVDAGKPFELLQRGGIGTAVMDDNLRARGTAVRAAARHANDGQVRAALGALGDGIVEAKGRIAERAVEAYLARTPDERERTVLLASGRVLREQLNARVQAGLRAEGTLPGDGLLLRVHEKVTTTREQERYLQTYERGLVAQFENGLRSQGLPVGLTATVEDVDRERGRVLLRGPDGKLYELDPRRLSPNRSENTVRLTREKALRIHEGEQLRFTDTDKERGLLNADLARVLKIGPDGVTIETATKIVMTLPHGDRMLGRIDLGYALNAHQAQGITADRGIAVHDSRERNLTSQRTFLVNITRVRDDVMLVVDDRERVTRALERNPGEKSAALETIGAIGLPEAIGLTIRPTRYPSATPRESHAASPQAAAVTPAQPSPSPASPAPSTAAPAPDATSLAPSAPAERPQTKAPVPQKQLEMDI